MSKNILNKIKCLKKEKLVLPILTLLSMEKEKRPKSKIKSRMMEKNFPIL